jgi:hypothetical protein
MDLKAIEVPYMYIHEQFGYSVQSIYRRFITESDADLGTYPDTFPNNIQEHFWIQPGEPTVKPWISLGQLTNGLYFYFTAFSTNKDGRFYVNTVTEEVPVEKVAPVKFVTPSNPMFPNMGLPFLRTQFQNVFLQSSILRNPACVCFTRRRVNFTFYYFRDTIS